MADFTDEDDALLGELGIEIERSKRGGRTPREERVIAGFEEIQHFVEQHGRAPQHGEDHDIFERLYAVRLNRLRALSDYHVLLGPLDHQGLVTSSESPGGHSPGDLDDDELLAQLGIGDASPPAITSLRHVRSSAEKQAAEEIANRQPCEDFEAFKPLFTSVQDDLKKGTRKTRQFVKDAGFLKADIKPGQFFVLGGQTAYVARVGEDFKAPNGETDARLRVIYSNGTESDLLLRSFQRALYKDEVGRRITEPVAGPLFADEASDEDAGSGTVYVLRSKSNHPTVDAHRDLVHKVGVTGGEVSRRIVNARLDPTFLMAEVEVIATYKLYNVNRTKIEALIHRVFGPARLDIEIKDRFGQPFVPREWFLVPLFIINEAVERIRDGTIIEFVYDPEKARLVRSSD